MNAYHIILNEENIATQRKYLRITNKGLKLAGLKEENYIGKLRNSSTNNTFGGGKEQLYTSDSGKTYRIKNSSTDNIYGGGKEKIIIEEGSSTGDGLAELLIEIVPWWAWIIIVVVILIIQKVCF